MSLTILIRSIGERTETVLKKLILDQGIAESDIHIVRETPFSKALEKSFEIGIQQNKKWTYCLDADILIRPDSLKKMYSYAEGVRPTVIRVQGFVLDKFFGGIRQAGNHLYRTSCLEELIECIPEEGRDIRPETRALQEIQKKGYQLHLVPYIVALHDHEQFARDIYRKVFVHGVKHQEKMPLFVQLWKKEKDHDIDFSIALNALAESIQYSGELYIDSEQKVYLEKFRESGFQEKNELSASDLTSDQIERMVLNWHYDDIYLKYYPDRDGFDRFHNAALYKLRRNLTGRNLLKSLGHSFGAGLIKTGRAIQRKIQ